MATWTVTPDDGVTTLIGAGGYFVTFPKNTSRALSSKEYTITYTGNDGCTASTTYSIPGGCLESEIIPDRPTGTTPTEKTIQVNITISGNTISVGDSGNWVLVCQLSPLWKTGQTEITCETSWWSYVNGKINVEFNTTGNTHCEKFLIPNFNNPINSCTRTDSNHTYYPFAGLDYYQCNAAPQSIYKAYFLSNNSKTITNDGFKFTLVYNNSSGGGTLTPGDGGIGIVEP